MPDILVFAGSLRKDSYNKKLARVAARALERTGANVTLLDINDYPMPPYDGDIQENMGLPVTAIRLKTLIQQSDGLIICAPEYNYAISGVVKNVIDWTSRPHKQGEKPLEVYEGKLVALMAASPSLAGGLRGLLHLRMVLSGIGMMVLPDQVTLAKAHEAFNDDDTLKDPVYQQAVESLAERLVEIAQRLKAPLAMPQETRAQRGAGSRPYTRAI